VNIIFLTLTGVTAEVCLGLKKSEAEADKIKKQAMQ
jgi:hypothetical protein